MKGHSQYQPSHQSQNRHATQKPRRNARNGIMKAIEVVFRILMIVIEVIAAIFKNAIALIVFLFKHLIEILANPSMPSVIAIAFFIFVAGVAAYQWGQIGAWIGSLVGLGGVAGLAASTIGVLVGIGINIYQMAPELWKIRRDMAKAYQDLGIKPDEDLDQPNNPTDRLVHWLSYDHGTLKGLRRTSYFLETALVLAYCALPGGLDVLSIVIAGVSLLGVEMALKGVGATTNLANAVNQKLSAQTQKEREDNPYGI